MEVKLCMWPLSMGPGDIDYMRSASAASEAIAISGVKNHGTKHFFRSRPKSKLFQRPQFKEDRVTSDPTSEGI